MDSMSSPPPYEDILRNSIQIAPAGFVDVVISCVGSGLLYWDHLFDMGLREAIAKDPKLELHFLRELCVGKTGTYSAAIVHSYFRGLDSAQTQRLFSEMALGNNKYFVHDVFSMATLPSTTPQALALLQVFIAFGLKDQFSELAHRRYQDVVAACRFNNLPFLNFLFLELTPAPVKLLKCVVADPQHGASLAGRLIAAHTIKLNECEAGPVFQSATSDVQQYLIALSARLPTREPDRYPTRR